MPTLSLTLLIILVVAATLLVRKALITKKYTRLPPGPTPLPIVGNVLDVPRKHLGREIAALSKQYGDVVYLNVLGQPILFLGTYEVAKELLEKRSATYSGRAQSVMSEMTGLDNTLGIKQYGRLWRRDRRVIHQIFNHEMMSRYHPIHLNASRTLLYRILTSPKDLVEQVKFSFAATTMRVAYGIELTEPYDHYFQMAEKVMRIVDEIAVPGRFLVDSFPILRYLPSWLPGMSFKRYASDAKRDVNLVVNTLFEAGMRAGGSGDSVLEQLLHGGSMTSDVQAEDLEEMCKNLAVTVYAAGADTTNTVLQAFFLAVAMNPQVQKKAQSELDRVVGADRLPDFSDRKALPYINALIKEVQRWHVIGPIGLPHRTTADDEYSGYHIPAGTIVVANTWAMSRDPNRYPDPDRFTPERFLDANGQLDLSAGDPINITFGFGRRICPGQHFADAAVFILCASVLHVFDIGPPLDADGKPKRMEHKMTTNVIVSHPEIDELTIKPRSPLAERLILEIATNAS